MLLVRVGVLVAVAVAVRVGVEGAFCMLPNSTLTS
jgi:hypothetical protein